MTITRTQFVLAVPDLETSSTFYRNVLGFTIHDMAPGWLRYERDTCSIMVGECPDALPPTQLGDHSYFAYLVIDDARAFYTKLTGKAEITKPLCEAPWGMREFGIRTVDGHRIMFGESTH